MPGGWESELALVTLLAHPYGQPNIFSSYKPFGQKPNYDYDGTPPADKDGFGAKVDCRDDVEGPNFNCEHRWTAVKAMVKWRRVAGATRDVKIFDQVWLGDPNLQHLTFSQPKCDVVM